MPNWIPDSIVEAKFAAANLKFTWRDRINLSEIDIKGSLRNNARLGEQLVEDNVIGIAESMLSGHPIPGIVLRDQASKKLLCVMGGNHRVGAVELNDMKTLGGYIITCSDQAADLFIRSDNRGKGIGQTDEEALEHIYNLIKGYPNASIAELARLFGLKVPRVQNVMLAMKLEEELEAAAINTKDLSMSAIVVLNKIHQNKDVFLKAASLAARFGIPSKEVAHLVDQVKNERSQTKQVLILDKWEKQLVKKAATPKSKKATPAKTKLTNLLTSRSGLLTLFRIGNKGKPIVTINDLCFTIDEAQEFIENWTALETHIDPLLKECKVWVKQHSNTSVSSRRPNRKKKGRK